MATALFDDQAREILARFTAEGGDTTVADIEHVAHDVALTLRAAYERGRLTLVGDGAYASHDGQRFGCALCELDLAQPKPGVAHQGPCVTWPAILERKKHVDERAAALTKGLTDGH